MSELESNQPSKALKSFREAIRHPPPTYDTAALEDCLARAYFRLQQFDEAAAEYERYFASQSELFVGTISSGANLRA